VLFEEKVMLKIGIVVGSTRPGRKADAVAQWVHEIATRRNDALYEIVDIQDFHLPLLDEPMPPSLGHYTQPHTKGYASQCTSSVACGDTRSRSRHAMLLRVLS
jgi:NAD(P)H-dependent FMN reductase